MAAESEKPGQVEESFSIEVPVKYYGVDEVVGIFADLAMVQHGGGVFTLTFFQNQMPTTENINVVRDLRELPSKCVARIVVTPVLMDQLVDAMVKNLGKSKRILEKQEREREGK